MKVCSRSLSKGQGHLRSKYDVISRVPRIQTFVNLKDYKKVKMIGLFLMDANTPWLQDYERGDRVVESFVTKWN